jgi:hypothetical protein
MQELQIGAQLDAFLINSKKINVQDIVNLNLSVSFKIKINRLSVD